MRAFLAPIFVAVFALGACGRDAPQQGAEPALTSSVEQPVAAARPKFNVAWSHYTGWEPWGYAAHAGILKKWADKFGIDVELTLVNDYIESINLYTGGKFDACVMTNMDALTIPAVGGVDSEVVIIGDYSNGNDGIVMKNGSTVAELRGRSVNLVELSVSHYLLARALDINGMTERDLTLVNTSDADIASLFTADPSGAAVTWNPPLMQARKAPGAKLVFDSSMVPGEILDLMVVKTAAPDTLKKALVGAWYEVIGVLVTPGPTREAAVAWMAESAGGSVDDFEAQLRTTAMYYAAADAVAFATSEDIKATMERVRQFTFSKGLFGQAATSPDAVGIAFPDGSVQGDPANVKLRFTATWMQAAAEGRL